MSVDGIPPRVEQQAASSASIRKKFGVHATDDAAAVRVVNLLIRMANHFHLPTFLMVVVALKERPTRQNHRN